MMMKSSCMVHIISSNLQPLTKPPPSRISTMLLIVTRCRLKHAFQVISLFCLNMKHVFRLISLLWLNTASRLQHVFQVKSQFWLHLFYFMFISLIGFLLLTAFPMKVPAIPRPSHLDLLFMSISATTVSSMDTVKIESFSNSQLIVLTILMLLGGEVFTSMLDLLVRNLSNYSDINNNAVVRLSSQEQAELGATMVLTIVPSEFISIKQHSLRYLLYVVLGYLILVHASGSIMISLYLSLFPNTKAVLKRKGIWVFKTCSGLFQNTSTVLTSVSSFANCGFVPTNENMWVFKTCSGILLIVGCLVLLGNTMYPLGLRVLAWVLKRFTRRKEFEFILSNN